MSAVLTNWSAIRMNWVLDLIDEANQRIRDDGSTLLDAEWDIFAPVSDIQPIFREYMDFTFRHDVVLSPNGRVSHLHHKLALAELVDPADDTNRRTLAKTVEYLQRGIRLVGDITPHLQGLSSTQLQLDWLREQIEMRVIYRLRVD
ncbi:MAG: hypothetical protein SGPRY_003975 [Prymnesium sp.]